MFRKPDMIEKCFYAILALGGAAGLIQSSFAGDFTMHAAFPGMLMVIVATFLGGFIGMLAKDFIRMLRRMKPCPPNCYESMLFCAVVGTLLGTLVQALSFDPDTNVVLGALAGAMAGGFIGALPDEHMPPLMRMVATGRIDEKTGLAAVELLEEGDRILSSND